ncbi:MULTISPECIES: acyltransferase [Microbacterium]|uniref:acyltransferase n=1 Tax=Microbacterium TaxID=33882 RepID=UPI00344FAA7D
MMARDDRFTGLGGNAFAAGVEQQSRAPEATRITWMDTLRGAAICLLILWRARSIPRRFGFEMPMWLFLLNETFLPWRMPTLMFLSGLLLAGSLRKSRSVYYVGKIRNLLWPYLLWAALYLALYPGAGESISSPAAWFGAGYLWFILYLFLYYVVVRAPWWVVLPFFTIAAMFIPHPSPQKICYFAVFLFAGHYGRTALPRLLGASRTSLAVLCVIAVGFTATSLALSATAGRHAFEFAPLSIPFVLALIAVSIRLTHAVQVRASDTPPMRWLSWVGRNSVVFYLSHVPVMLVVCAASERASSDLGIWVVVLCGVAALLGGIPLALTQRHAVVSWLFRAPHLPRLETRRSRVRAVAGGSS